MRPFVCEHEMKSKSHILLRKVKESYWILAMGEQSRTLLTVTRYRGKASNKGSDMLGDWRQREQATRARLRIKP